MARSSYTVQNLRVGTVRFLVGPDGVLVQKVAKLQRAIFNAAKLKSPVDFGVLRNSHQMSPIVVVGLRARGSVSATAKYAAAVHDGSPARTIRPVNGTYLKFQIGDRTIYAKSVNMPARAGRPWLLNAATEQSARLGFQVI